MVDIGPGAARILSGQGQYELIRMIVSLGALGMIILLNASPVAAQGAVRSDAPIGWYVVDVYGSFAPLGQNEELGVDRGFSFTPQPGLAIGFTAGAHVFPLRLGLITVGLGATFHDSFRDKGPEATEDEPNPEGPTLRKRFTAISPQLSLNFGGRDGWSYLSAGTGTSRLSLFALNTDVPPQRRAGTFNYGGGARWFTDDHLAFSLDLRFYNAGPLLATATEPGSPRSTIMVINIGASFR